MAIEAIELRTSVLPEGYSAQYSEDFGGALTIRRDGDLVSVGKVGDDEGAFFGAFNGRGKIIFESWKQFEQEQIDPPSSAFGETSARQGEVIFNE